MQLRMMPHSLYDALRYPMLLNGRLGQKIRRLIAASVKMRKHWSVSQFKHSDHFSISVCKHPYYPQGILRGKAVKEKAVDSG